MGGETQEIVVVDGKTDLLRLQTLPSIKVFGAIRSLTQFRQGDYDDVSRVLQVATGIAQTSLEIPDFLDQGCYKNDFIGVEFEPLIPGGPKVSGEYVAEDIFGISLARSKWIDLMAIFILLVSCKILFFLIVKLREKAYPVFRMVYARVTLKQAMRQPPSLKRKLSSLSSRFHVPQAQHPLALQEGLSSPLP